MVAGGTATEVSPALAAFRSWLSANGVKEGDGPVDCGQSRLTGGRGLVATRPIKSGQVVAVVPQALALTAASARASGIGPYIKGFDDLTAGDAGYIALQLLWERSLGGKSSLKPWLDVLPAGPADLGLPLLWETDMLDLADRSSTRRMKCLLDDLQRDFDRLDAEVFAKNRQKFPAQAFSFELFKWAVAVALSRSFFVDGALRLTPLVDFANHRAGGTSEPQEGSLGIFGGKAVQLLASATYSAGDEFFVSYGPRHAAEYLEDYGFVPAATAAAAAGPVKERSAGSCEVVMAVAASDRFFDDKADVLEINGEFETRQSFDLDAAGELNPEMMRFLRLALLGGMDAFLLEALFRNDVWGFMELPVSPANEAAVNSHIICRCEEELKRFVSTAEEDAILIKSADGGSSVAGDRGDPRLVMLARVRAGERAALRHTLEWCQRDNEALDRKEYYQDRRLRELKLDRPLDSSEVDGGGGRGPREYDW